MTASTTTICTDKSRATMNIVFCIVIFGIALNLILHAVNNNVYLVDFDTTTDTMNTSNVPIYRMKQHLYSPVTENITLPLSHIPQLNELNLSKLIIDENQIRNFYVQGKSMCTFKGKVFVLGVPKTGTSTMSRILQNNLGFTCGKHPMKTCGYYGLYYYLEDAYLPLYVAPDDISWIFHSKPLFKDFMESLQMARAFADAPWCFLYPLFDQLIPANHSKFILLQRDSTRDVINSNMKMFARKDTRTMQYDYTNFTMNPRKAGIKLKWEQFWMIVARQYELHNKNVIEYFTKRDRLNDLLIINLGEESRKKRYSEQWYKITNFLGCRNVTNKPLPHENKAVHEQIDFFPQNYTIHWQDFKFPQSVSRIWNFVKKMNGTYDENIWQILKGCYGNIFITKH